MTAFAGPSPLGGPADLLLVAEEPGVGLGAAIAGIDGLDPGLVAVGAPDAKIVVAGHPTPLWRSESAADRVSFVGEASGVWLWAVLWPPAAELVLLEQVELHDLRHDSHAALALPVGADFTAPALTHVLIDLHTHSTASDGTLSPAELMTAAHETGLGAVALTDHDTTEGWDRAAEALPAGLVLVRGAELSCRHGDISLHLLAYLFDPSYPPLIEAMEALRASRTGRAEAMVAALVADGAPVTWEQVRAQADGVVGRPHIARALVGVGLVSSLEEAFTSEWIGARGKYWVERHELDVLEAVDLVAEAGGVSVFAHPAAVARGRVVADEVIEELAAAGLIGLEVDHPDHSAQARAHLRAIADDLGLVITGSSDFHGTNKAVQLGDSRTDPRAFEALVAAATGAELLTG